VIRPKSWAWTSVGRAPERCSRALDGAGRGFSTEVVVMTVVGDDLARFLALQRGA
jgi:hypothetical protein